jgi:hypothetical protein
MGIASLILGIAGILLPFVGLLLACAALVLGILAYRKGKQRGPALGGIITGGIGIVLEPIVWAFLVPVFIDDFERDETQEASQSLDQMYEGVYHHYLRAGHAGPDGGAAGARLPASVGWTPQAPCCEGADEMCQPDAAAWAHPTWQALEFEMTEPHRFQYRLVVEGGQVLCQARGDRDCDGEYSLFERVMPIPPRGTYDSQHLRKVDPLE